MGHKTLIGGTAYEIKGGKTLIGGTAYDIKGGKTLIGGTGYDISFAPVPTLEGLFASATIEKSVGRNSSSTGTVYLTSVPVGTSYLFSFCNGYVSTYKVTKADANSNPTLTGLSVSTASYGKAFATTGGFNYSSNGTSNTAVRAATLVLFTFSAYTDAQREALLTFTPTRLAGRNNTSTGTVTSEINTSTTFYAFTAYNSYMGFSKVSNGTITNICSNHTVNPGLLYLNGTTLGLSNTGTSFLSCYGASLIAIGG